MALRKLLPFILATLLFLAVVPGCGGSNPSGSMEKQGPTHFCPVDPSEIHVADAAEEPKTSTDRMESQGRSDAAANTANGGNNAVETPQEPAFEIEDKIQAMTA